MNNIVKTLIVSFLLISCKSSMLDSGLIVKTSPYDVETTYSKLKDIITNNPNLTLLLDLDHSKNAASVDLNLEPTRVLMFGNPKLGTPLMKSNQSIGIDLPQKILIYASPSSGTKISYNDPMHLKKRHHISGNDDVFKKISKALDDITNKVITAK